MVPALGLAQRQAAARIRGQQASKRRSISVTSGGASQTAMFLDLSSPGMQKASPTKGLATRQPGDRQDCPYSPGLRAGTWGAERPSRGPRGEPLRGDRWGSVCAPGPSPILTFAKRKGTEAPYPSPLGKTRNPCLFALG